MNVIRLAFDRSSVRTIDANGHMHVEMTNVSKAMVCPYFGREIPEAESLGLDASKSYMLLRDPQELTAAADTLNGQPLMIEHVVVSAEVPHANKRVGALGTDAKFEAPYLRNSMSIWDQLAIDLIESRQQCELSAGYRYDADMTPGEFQGVKYDGIMRNIKFNHVALVEDGRAGPDVVVADSNPVEFKQMKLSRVAIASRAAIMVHLTPVLAMDAAAKKAVTDLVRPLTSKNFAASKKALVSGVQKLAADADPAALMALVDALDPCEDAELAGDEEDDEELTDEEKAAKKKAEEEAKAKDEIMTGGAETAKAPTKAAMDAAIRAAETTTVKRMQAINLAIEETKPLIGAVVAMDSAEEYYRLALDAAKVDTADVHPSALRSLFQMHMRHQAAASRPAPRLAYDGATVKTMATKFPALDKIRSI